MSLKFCCQTLARNSTVNLYIKCWKSTVLRTDSPSHTLLIRRMRQTKKIVQLWKGLALCFTPVNSRKNCGLKPVILRYIHSTLLDLHQWKVKCLWSCGLDLMKLLVTCVILGHNVMCTFPSRKGTNGTKL